MLIHFRTLYTADTLYTAYTNGGTSAKIINMMSDGTLNCNDMKLRFDIKTSKFWFQNASLAYLRENDHKDLKNK